MKIRKGFVSNSSSSSFIICSDTELGKEMLLDAFECNKDSPAFFIIEKFASDIASRAKVFDSQNIAEEFGYTSIQELIKNPKPDDFDNYYHSSIWQALVDSDGQTKIYQYSAESDDYDNPVAAFLYAAGHATLLKTDTVVIEHWW